MGGQMWHLLEAQAKALGEEAEFLRFQAFAEGLSNAIGEEANVDAIKHKFVEMMMPKPLNIGLLTRKDLELRWRVSKHIIKRYEKMGMPVAMRVGGRPRYDWKGVEKWREEALNGERASGDGTGACARETPRAAPEKSILIGKQPTARSLPHGRKPRPDLLSSYGNSKTGLPRPV